VRLIPWAEIESIQVRKGTSGIGPVVGGALGLVVGGLIVAVEAVAAVTTFPPHKVNGTPIPVGLVGGATLGWLLDHRGPWKTVYP
jgi:hypothetical protein